MQANADPTAVAGLPWRAAAHAEMHKTMANAGARILGLREITCRRPVLTGWGKDSTTRRTSNGALAVLVGNSSASKSARSLPGYCVAKPRARRCNQFDHAGCRRTSESFVPITTA